MTSPTTYAVTMNGRIHTELKSHDRTPIEELRHRVHLLDGVERYSLLLWKLPEGVPFDRVDLNAWPLEYVQAAGGGDRFTVEERRVVGGESNQYVLGRDPVAEPSEDEVIHWNGVEAQVRSNEVWTSDEVAELFTTYVVGGELPPALTRRPLIT